MTLIASKAENILLFLVAQTPLMIQGLVLSSLREISKQPYNATELNDEFGKLFGTRYLSYTR
jgi:hypothetical protein